MFEEFEIGDQIDECSAQDFEEREIRLSRRSGR
jgi:hypothetical protein